MPDAIAGSHGDPAHSVDGQVRTAQAGTRSPLRTGAPLSTHIRVISCGRHAQRLSRSAAALTSRCSFPAPAAGGHSQGAGRVGSESPRSLLTDSCVISESTWMRTDAGRADGAGRTEGTVPGASKGGHTCRGPAVPSRT